MVLPDTGLFVFKRSWLRNNCYFHNSNFLIKKGKEKKKIIPGPLFFHAYLKKVLRNPQQPGVISNFLTAPSLRDWQSEGAAGALQRCLQVFGTIFRQISRLKRGQVFRQWKQSRENSCVLIHKEERKGFHHKNNINNNSCNRRRWQSCVPQLGWAVWGGCRREMLAEGLPTVNATSSIQQGEPSQRCPRASLCSPPPALNPFKTTQAIWVFHATERSERKHYCVLIRAHPAPKGFRPSLLLPRGSRLAPGLYHTAGHCRHVFLESKGHSWMHRPRRSTWHLAVGLRGREMQRIRLHISIFSVVSLKELLIKRQTR